jgi:hypothetical protein
MNMLNIHTNSFMRMTGSSPTLFIKRIFAVAIDDLRTGKEDKNDSVLAQLARRIAMFERLHDQVLHLEHDLLLLVGFRDEVTAVQLTACRILYVISCLEDLRYQSSEGYDKLQSAYEKLILAFQQS